MIPIVQIDPGPVPSLLMVIIAVVLDMPTIIEVHRKQPRTVLSIGAAVKYQVVTFGQNIHEKLWHNHNIKQALESKQHHQQCINCQLDSKEIFCNKFKGWRNGHVITFKMLGSGKT